MYVCEGGVWVLIAQLLNWIQNLPSNKIFDQNTRPTAQKKGVTVSMKTDS